MGENDTWEEHWLTLVVNTPPAMSSRVLAQALVVLPSDVVSPLQDGDVTQIFPSKFSFGDLILDTVGAGLQEAEYSTMPLSKHNQGDR